MIIKSSSNQINLNKTFCIIYHPKYFYSSCRPKSSWTTKFTHFISRRRIKWIGDKSSRAYERIQIMRSLFPWPCLGYPNLFGDFESGLISVNIISLVFNIIKEELTSGQELLAWWSHDSSTLVPSLLVAFTISGSRIINWSRATSSRNSTVQVDCPEIFLSNQTP